MEKRHQVSRSSHSADFVFGVHPVSEALKSGKEIEKILVLKGASGEGITEILDQARDLRLPVQKVPKEKLSRITRKNHQGIIAYLSPITFASLDNIINECFANGKDPFILILDRITDIRNFGAIARTALSAGVDALVVPGKESALISGDSLKTSAGALLHIPVCRSLDLVKTIKEIKAQGIVVLGISEKTEKMIYDTDLSVPVALVLGSEEKGIHPVIMKFINEGVRIPMKGNIDSLNVSVAAGIAAFEVVRQRSYK